jgi:hypothetical protein
MAYRAEDGLGEIEGRGGKGMGSGGNQIGEETEYKMMELDWHETLYKQGNGRSVRHVAGGRGQRVSLP